MTELSCSVCWTRGILTQIAGTVICKECLAKTVEKYKSNDDSLKQNLADSIAKVDDIYS